ncbi:MAG: ATP-binding protein [Legionellaceae bacterium]|nr:ATP-binding protein [Legionellaceae bacterium]
MKIKINDLLWQYSDEFMIILDHSGLLLEMNPVAETVCEKSKTQIADQNFFMICEQLGLTLSFNLNDVEKNARQETKFEIHITSTKNHKYFFDAKFIKFLNQKKQVNYLIIGKNVTDNFKNEKLISTQKMYLQNIIESLPQYVYWKDQDLIYRGCNSLVASSLNLKSPNDIIGKTDSDFGWSEDRIMILHNIDQEILEKGLSHTVEEQIPLHGTIKTMLSSKVALHNITGEINGVLGISIDITDRKRLEEELRLAKEAAEAAVNAKTEFIANMSHDIRTPLTGVIGMSEILRDEVENPEHKQDATLLAESGQQLLIMLNEILEDVRADNLTETDLQEESFDLYQCIENLIKLESPTTASKHLGLEYIIEPDVPQFIISDRKKIHHTLLNLLGNAIKFTKKGLVTIHVKCLDRTAKDTHLEFSVADTGIGIPKSLQKKVFDRFFRIDPSYKGHYRGYGLGLHIVQTYVYLLGGHVTLTSNENNGATFHFDLRCQISKDKSIKYNQIDTPLTNPSNDAMPSEIPSSPTTNESTPLLLLIEDNELALKVLEIVVTKADLRFLSATNGEDALQLVQNNTFDLIITDIGLPGISGNEFTKQLRLFEKDHGNIPIPVIGLTGHAYDGAKRESMDSGMNDIFSKPINSEILNKITKQFINQEPQKFITPLGPDLPNTMEELFLLGDFPLFDPKDAIKYTGNLPFLVEVLNDYLSEKMQQDIINMEKAYLIKNWSEIERLAHKIKSGAMTIGIVRMRYACQYLERYHKTGHHEFLDKLYHQLLTVNQETISTLRAWLLQFSQKNSD